MKDRITSILNLLTRAEDHRIEVSQLSEALGVSQVTVRKDLDELERRQMISREHGFAVLKDSDDITGRLAYHYEEKVKIASRACRLIKDNDTVMIESGSCCAILADICASEKKNLVIITNSVFIAQQLRGRENIQVVLLGGIFQSDSQVLVGPMIRQCVENYSVDLFFIGTDGYSEQSGFTNRDHLRTQAVRDMAERADNVVILTESEKFKKHGVMSLNLDDKKCTVITDGNIDDASRKGLKKRGIRLVCV